VNVRLIINALCKFWDQLWTIISILKRRYTIEQLQTSRLRKFPETKASRGDFLRKALSLKTSEEWQNKSTLKQKKKAAFYWIFSFVRFVHYLACIIPYLYLILSSSLCHILVTIVVILRSLSWTLIMLRWFLHSEHHLQKQQQQEHGSNVLFKAL